MSGRPTDPDDLPPMPMAQAVMFGAWCGVVLVLALFAGVGS